MHETHWAAHAAAHLRYEEVMRTPRITRHIHIDIVEMEAFIPVHALVASDLAQHPTRLRGVVLQLRPEPQRPPRGVLHLHAQHPLLSAEIWCPLPILPLDVWCPVLYVLHIGKSKQRGCIR